MALTPYNILKNENIYKDILSNPEEALLDTNQEQYEYLSFQLNTLSSLYPKYGIHCRIIVLNPKA